MKRKRVKSERDADRKLSNMDFGVHFYILIYEFFLVSFFLLVSSVYTTHVDKTHCPFT